MGIMNFWVKKGKNQCVTCGHAEILHMESEAKKKHLDPSRLNFASMKRTPSKCQENECKCKEFKEK